MDIILVQDIDRLGKAGQKLTVKDGFARNYLFPRGLALSATPSVRARMEALRSAQLRQAEQQKAKAAEVAGRLKEASCSIPVTVGDQGKLHGAVTAVNILRSLKEQGIVLEKHQIVLERPLTELGTFQVAVKLHPEIVAALTVSLVRKKK